MAMHREHNLRARLEHRLRLRENLDRLIAGDVAGLARRKLAVQVDLGVFIVIDEKLKTSVVDARGDR